MKMVISLVVEGEEKVLKGIKNDILGRYSDDIVSVSANVVTESRKEVDLSMMYPKMFRGGYTQV